MDRLAQLKGDKANVTSASEDQAGDWQVAAAGIILYVQVSCGPPSCGLLPQ